jgi:hypothetical protein
MKIQAPVGQSYRTMTVSPTHSLANDSIVDLPSWPVVSSYAREAGQLPAVQPHAEPVGYNRFLSGFDDDIYAASAYSTAASA